MLLLPGTVLRCLAKINLFPLVFVKLLLVLGSEKILIPSQLGSIYMGGYFPFMQIGIFPGGSTTRHNHQGREY